MFFAVITTGCVNKETNRVGDQVTVNMQLNIAPQVEIKNNKISGRQKFTPSSVSSTGVLILKRLVSISAQVLPTVPEHLMHSPLSFPMVQALLRMALSTMHA